MIGVITKTGTINNVTCNCPKCASNQKFTFQLVTKFFHFLWLRCFIITNNASFECSNCQTVFKNRNLTSEMVAISNAIKKQHKNFVVNHLGLFAILGIIIWMNLPQSESEKQRIKELNEKYQKEFVEKIKTPKYNDVYYLKKTDTTIDNKDFSRTAFLIVKEVTKDSVIFNLCKFDELSQKRGKTVISEGFKKEYYDPSNSFENKIKVDRTQILKDTTIANLKIFRIEREESQG